eukprot:11679502-Karenia_brevis.AAC.1
MSRFRRTVRKRPEPQIASATSLSPRTTQRRLVQRQTRRWQRPTHVLVPQRGSFQHCLPST